MLYVVRVGPQTGDLLASSTEAGVYQVIVDGDLLGVVFPSAPISVKDALQKLEAAGKVRAQIVGHKVETPSDGSGFTIRAEDEIVLEMKAFRRSRILVPSRTSKLYSVSNSGPLGLYPQHVL